MKWICGNLDYKDALVQSNFLPPLYYKVLKDLLLFSNILEGRYNVDFSKEFKITNSGRKRRVVLPDTRYEIEAEFLVQNWIQNKRRAKIPRFLQPGESQEETT